MLRLHVFPTSKHDAVYKWNCLQCYFLNFLPRLIYLYLSVNSYCNIDYYCTYMDTHTQQGGNSVFARIESGQGADLGKGHFCVRSIILRALLRVILHFEGTMGK